MPPRFEHALGQAHLNRAFVGRYGVTQRLYQRQLGLLGKGGTGPALAEQIRSLHAIRR